MADPQPVEVKNDPLPVEVVIQTDTSEQSDARKVSAAASVDARRLQTEDQRRISGIWERTQQIIALSVIESTLVVILILVLRQDANMGTALTIMFGLANLVIGFYFGRTNHQRTGGQIAPGEEDKTR